MPFIGYTEIWHKITVLVPKYGTKDTGIFNTKIWYKNIGFLNTELKKCLGRKIQVFQIPKYGTK